MIAVQSLMQERVVCICLHVIVYVCARARLCMFMCRLVRVRACMFMHRLVRVRACLCVCGGGQRERK